MPTQITSFRGEYFFLSNFFPSDLVIDDMHLVFPTAEHAFQAFKFTEPRAQRRFALPTTITAKQAKRLGRQLPRLRCDWDDAKLNVMAHILAIKFAPGTELAQPLLNTWGAQLIEGNTWDDRYWGACWTVARDELGDDSGRWEGENHLGKLLTAQRASLAAIPGL